MVIRGLKEKIGAAVPKIVDHEAEKILEKCVSMTPAAKVGKIRDRMEAREWGIHNAGRGPKTYKYSNRYPNPTWAAIQRDRKRSLEFRLKNRGLSKHSWLLLAKSAGLHVNSPSFVSKTAARHPGNAESKRISGANSYSINFRNSQPTIRVIGGSKIVRRAINGRIAYFKKNMELGVLDTLEGMARAYPGLVQISKFSGQKVLV